MKRNAQNFLIIAGALTAFGLPFALAFPRTLLEKLVCIAALVAAACLIAAAIVAIRRNNKSGSEPD
jgi:amino acid transporter